MQHYTSTPAINSSYNHVEKLDKRIRDTLYIDSLFAAFTHKTLCNLVVLYDVLNETDVACDSEEH